MKQMTSKFRRFTKRTWLLLMLLGCGVNAFGQWEVTYESLNTYNYGGVEYEEWSTSFLGLAETSLSVIGFVGGRDDVTISSGTTFLHYARGVCLDPISSDVIKTIRFKGNPSWRPNAQRPTFDCPNLTDIYFEGERPNFSGNYSDYFRAPAAGQITLHMSEMTPAEVYEIKSQNLPVWRDFKDIVSTQTVPKRTITLVINDARVKIGNNYYEENQTLTVDMYTDLTFEVDQLYYDQYEAISVMVNGKEILPSMTFSQASNNYSYTIAPVVDNTTIVVTGKYIYTSANVICGYGGKCRKESSSTYFYTNDKNTISWIKGKNPPAILIEPDEGFTIDCVYSNSELITTWVYPNGDGTFSYQLTPEANVSVTFKEIAKMTKWNVIQLGDAEIKATIKDQRGQEEGYQLTNGENEVPENMRSMTMVIKGDLQGKSLVVNADMLSLTDYFEMKSYEEFDEYGYPIPVNYYGTRNPIPAEALTAKNWVIGLKDAGSQTVAWMMNTKGELPDTWSASVYVDDNESPLMSISDQSLTASAPAVPRTVGKMKFEINGGDDYNFMLYYNGRPILSSAYCSNGEFVTEDQSFFLPMLDNDGIWTVEFSKKPVEIIQFADSNVEAICVENWDTDHDGKLSKAEAAAVTTLIDSETNKSVFSNKTGITSFDELRYFTGLTTIEENAFERCMTLSSIKLPESITQLNTNGFYYCTSLKHIQLPNGLETLSERALAKSGITSIFIPKSVKSIGYGVFYDCTQLQSIVVEEGNEKYSSPNGCNAIVSYNTVASVSVPTLLAGCKNTTIPEDVCWIGNSAFSGQKELTKIVIPSKVYSIGKYAFYGCSKLTSVVMERTEPFNYTLSWLTGVDTDAFKGISAECVLTVPHGTRQAYLDAGWSESIFKGGIEEAPLNCDVNGDGQVSISDAVIIVDEILNK